MKQTFTAMTMYKNDDENQESAEFTILTFLPTGRDASLVGQTLESAGLEIEICEDFAQLTKRLEYCGGVVLLAEEALKENDFNRLVEITELHPIWSDVPFILLAGSLQNSELLLKSVGTRLNITIVERPVTKAILISALRGALRARAKQYDTRDLLVKLEEADRQKDLFLATLSHELRTPLNAMLGWIELLKRPEEGFDKKHALDVIERNAKAQTQIISDILLLSRIVTGKFEIENKPINLNDVVKAAVDVVRPLIKTKEVNLEVFYKDDVNTIQGDFDRLQQVFWNLFSNAVKFTRNNGNINITIERENSSAAITITDDGQGIKADFLPFIFERFRQADNSYTRNIGGLGLGLAIVKNIIEQHGGTVVANSDGEGFGATFKVTLPLAVPAKTEISETIMQSDENKFSLAGLRVLLAEDDDDSREMLVFLLEQQNIKIEAVENAAAALTAFSIEPPQVFISDVGMPDMDGYELLKTIRKLPPEKGGKVPAIALTGYASQQDKISSSEVGFQAHLTKPINFDELFETIEKVAHSQV